MHDWMEWFCDMRHCCDSELNSNSTLQWWDIVCLHCDILLDTFNGEFSQIQRTTRAHFTEIDRYYAYAAILQEHFGTFLVAGSHFQPPHAQVKTFHIHFRPENWCCTVLRRLNFISRWRFQSVEFYQIKFFLSREFHTLEFNCGLNFREQINKSVEFWSRLDWNVFCVIVAKYDAVGWRKIYFRKIFQLLVDLYFFRRGKPHCDAHSQLYSSCTWKWMARKKIIKKRNRNSGSSAKFQNYFCGFYSCDWRRNPRNCPN